MWLWTALSCSTHSQQARPISNAASDEKKGIAVTRMDFAKDAFPELADITDWLKRNIRVINIIGGALLMLIGLAMVTGLWQQFISSLGAVIGGTVTPL